MRMITKIKINGMRLVGEWKKKNNNSCGGGFQVMSTKAKWILSSASSQEGPIAGCGKLKPPKLCAQGGLPRVLMLSKQPQDSFMHHPA
jgi:hypothetical protein